MNKTKRYQNRINKKKNSYEERQKRGVNIWIGILHKNLELILGTKGKHLCIDHPNTENTKAIMRKINIRDIISISYHHIKQGQIYTCNYFRGSFSNIFPEINSKLIISFFIDTQRANVREELIALSNNSPDSFILAITKCNRGKRKSIKQEFKNLFNNHNSLELHCSPCLNLTKNKYKGYAANGKVKTYFYLLSINQNVIEEMKIKYNEMNENNDFLYIGSINQNHYYM